MNTLIKLIKEEMKDGTLDIKIVMDRALSRGIVSEELYKKIKNVAESK